MRRFLFLIAGMPLFAAPCFTDAQQPSTSKTDAFGDPLPLGAVARIGTVKYRVFSGEHARLSPDGKLLAVPGKPGEIDLWEMPEWKNRRTLRPSFTNDKKWPELQHIRFSPNGKTLAAFDYEGQRIAFFDVPSAKCVKVLKLPKLAGRHGLDIVMAADGKNFAAAETNQEGMTIFQGDLPAGKMEVSLETNRCAMAIFADCRRCLTARGGGGLELRDLTAQKTVWTISQVGGPYSALAIAPDGKQLVVADQSSVRIVDAAIGKELVHRRRRASYVSCVAYTRDGTSIYLAESDRHEFTVWDATAGKQTASYPFPEELYVRQVVFTPGGQVLALGHQRYTSGNVLYLWDVREGKMLSPSNVPVERARDVFFSPTGDLHLKSYSGVGFRWNSRTGAKLGDYPPAADSPLNGLGSSQYHVPFANASVAASLHNHTVRIWDTRTGLDTGQFTIPLAVNQTASIAAMSANGRYVAVAIVQEKQKANRLLVWDQEKNGIVRVCKNLHHAFVVAFSGDGRWLAYVDADGRARFGRVDGPAQEFPKLDKIAEKVECLALSPDGRQLACAVSADDLRKIYLCETAGGTIVRAVHAEPLPVFPSLTYSQDGTLLAGVSHYDSVLIWETGLPPLPIAAAKLNPAKKAAAKVEPKTPKSSPEKWTDPLPNGALTRIGTTRYWLPGNVERTSVRLSTTGGHVAALTSEGAIEVWQLPGWTARPPLRPAPCAEEKPARFTFFSFDSDRRVALFDLASGKPNRHIALPEEFDCFGRAAIATSPDGRDLACSGWIKLQEDAWAHETRIFSLADGKTKRTMRVPFGSYPAGKNPEPVEETVCPPVFFGGRIIVHDGDYAVHAISPDSQWLAIGNIPPSGGSPGSVIELWNCTTGTSVRKCDFGSKVAEMTFSPDGKFLAVRPHEETTIRVYETATGKERHNLRLFDWWLRGFVFAPDSRSFFTAGTNYDVKTCRQWNLATGELMATYGSPFSQAAQQLAVSPEGKLVALAVVDGAVHCWQPQSQTCLSPIGAFRHPIGTVHFSEQGELFVGAQNGDAAWWNPRTGARLRTLTIDPARGGYRQAMDVNGDTVIGHVRCSRNNDRVGWIAKSRTGEYLHGDRSQSGETLSLFAAGRKAASINGNVVRVWNVADGRDVARFEIKPWNDGEVPVCMSVSEDGRYFAVAIEDRLVLWDQQQQAIRNSWHIHEPRRETLRFSRDGQWLAFTEAGDCVRAIRIDGSWADLHLRLGEEETVTCLAFSADARQLACAVKGGSKGESRTVVCEMASGKVRAEFAGHLSAAINSVAFSPDGALLASGSDDTTVLVWRIGLFEAKHLAGKESLIAALAKMGGADARTAFAGMVRLAHEPDEAVALLNKKFAPAGKVDLKGRTVAQWIGDLSDERFAVRDAAASILLKLGRRAETELRAAHADLKDLETKLRIEQLLVKMTARTLSAEEIAQFRAVELAEAIATPEARALLRHWAEGEAGALLTEEARRRNPRPN